LTNDRFCGAKPKSSMYKKSPVAAGDLIGKEIEP